MSKTKSLTHAAEHECLNWQKQKMRKEEGANCGVPISSVSPKLSSLKQSAMQVRDQQ